MQEQVRYIAQALRNRFRREDGQTLMEYALLLAFIALLVVVAVAVLGGALMNFWQDNIIAKFPSG